jgi:hypothetical protein
MKHLALSFLLFALLSAVTLRAERWTFNGYLADFHEVSVFLSVEEEGQLNGWLLYTGLGDSLFLEGFRRGAEWIFMEYNKEGIPTGTFHLEMNYGKLEGYYRDRRELFEWSVELWSHRSSLPQPAPRYPISYFSNGNKKGALSLLMHHRNDEYVTGWLQMQGETLCDFRGELNSQGEYLLEVSTLEGKARGFAVLRFFEDNYALQMEFSDPDQSQPLQEHLHIKQTVWAVSGYGLLSEIAVPMLNRAGLGEELQRATESWFGDLQSSAKQLDSSDPDSRHSILGSGWFEISKVNERVFSGYFVLTNNHIDPRYQIVPLTFSLDKSRSMTLTSHFKEGGLDQFINPYKALSLGENGPSTPYEQWLHAQTFEDCVLAEGGLLLLSDYHPLYGLKKIYITKLEAKKALKRFSKLRRFL